MTNTAFALIIAVLSIHPEAERNMPAPKKTGQSGITYVAREMELATRRAVPGAPKYSQLYEVIVAAIDAGCWGAGDKLPSETDFARAVPVSLGTVQRALRLLSEQGIVVRRHGKGTFVAGEKSLEPDLWHFRFLDDDGRSLLPVFSRVISADLVDEIGPWTAFLGPEESYVRLRRILDINHEFRLFSAFFIGAARFGAMLDMSREELSSRTLREVLRDSFGAPTLRVEERIHCRELTPWVCGEIEVPVGTIGIVCDLFGFGLRDTPVSYQRVSVPPNGRALQIADARASV